MATVLAKMECLIDDIVPEPSKSLLSDAKASEEVILVSMKPFCTILTCFFEYMVDAFLNNKVMEVLKAVSLIFTDPQYNTRN